MRGYPLLAALPDRSAPALQRSCSVSEFRTGCPVAGKSTEVSDRAFADETLFGFLELPTGIFQIVKNLVQISPPRKFLSEENSEAS